ncbi:MAG: hypothetical protein KDA22_08170 [Phycisphaerales bacterium]|nr:hypothetical protein [Phycisphaerales bacterium]
MRSSILVCVGALSLPLAAGTVLAAPVAATATDQATAEGTVKSVDAKAGTFVLTVVGKDINIRTNAQTKFLLDGKDSTMEKVVHAGAKLKVTHADGLASSISGNAPKSRPSTPPAKPKK